jgi:pilus assembly protein CpaF
MGLLRDQIGNWNYGQSKIDGDGLSSAASDSAVKPAVETSPYSDIDKFHVNHKMQASFYEAKVKLHQKLLSRLDLAAAETMSTEQLGLKLKDLINKLIDEDALPVNNDERHQLISDLQNEILGLGPIEPLLADPTITEILVNGYDRVFIERQGQLELMPIQFNNNEHLLRIIDKIVSRVGRRIDESSPMADARLPDGSRVNAIIPPIALDGPTLSIRRFSVVPLRIEDLIRKHALTKGMAEFLAAMVRAKTSILISGGTGSGKTTLLNILSSFIPEGERIITIEDTAELQLQQTHVVRLETRPQNIEGKGEVPMRALVRNSLRMRPDRIVLGEVRGSEVIDMLQAMNTGHEGSLTTIHANTARDALSRLENLVNMGGVQIPIKTLRQQISSAIHIVIQTARLTDGSRKITSIQEITGMEGDMISMQEIFTYERTGTGNAGVVLGHFRATGLRPLVADRIKTWGIALSDDLFEPGVIE